MQFNKEDIERIASNLIERLTISVEPIKATDPNTRIVVLKLGDKVISYDCFDIREADEYRG